MDQRFGLQRYRLPGFVRGKGLLSVSTARRLAVLVAGSRAALGLVALLSPRRVARPWIGEVAEDRGPTLLSRALGGRDLALGLGPLLSLRRGGSIRAWIGVGVLADLVDASVTIGEFHNLPRRGRWMVLGAAGSAAIVGALAGLSLEAATN